MKSIPLLLFLFVSVFCFSQKKSKYIYYEMGRPNKFEHYNAVKQVQKKWKIEFIYVSGSGVYSTNLDSLINQNVETNNVLNNKYGENWNAEFHEDVSEMAKKQNRVREILFSDSVAFKNMYIEVYIKNKRKAEAKVFKKAFWEGEKKYVTFYKYTVFIKKKRVKLIFREKELIDFSYPQNDIIN